MARTSSPIKQPLGAKIEGMRLEYLGGEVITPAGATATATIPADTDTIAIDAEGGAIYYVFNSAGDAAATSPGYVPQDQSRWECLQNLSSLKVFGAVGAKAHVRYYVTAV